MFKNKMNYLMLILLLNGFICAVENTNTKYIETQKKYKQKMVSNPLVFHPGPEGWVNIGGMDIDDSGNLYILDQGTGELYKFAKDGKLLNKTGRMGQGPGEFQRPYNLFVSLIDGVYVHDGQSLKLFSDQFKYQKQIQLQDFYHQVFQVNEKCFVGISRQYIQNSKNKMANVLGISILNPIGQTIKTILQFPYPVKKQVLENKRAVSLFIDHYYVSKLSITKTSYGFICAHGRQYKVYKFDHSGNNIGVIEKKEITPIITDYEKKMILKDCFKRMDSLSINTIKTAIHFSKTKPFLNKLLANEKGHIYVQRLGTFKNREKLFQFDVFDAEGKEIDHIALEFSPEIIDKGFYYYFNNNIDETQVIRVSIARK